MRNLETFLRSQDNVTPEKVLSFIKKELPDYYLSLVPFTESSQEQRAFTSVNEPRNILFSKSTKSKIAFTGHRFEGQRKSFEFILSAKDDTFEFARLVVEKSGKYKLEKNLTNSSQCFACHKGVPIWGSYRPGWVGAYGSYHDNGTSADELMQQNGYVHTGFQEEIYWKKFIKVNAKNWPYSQLSADGKKIEKLNLERLAKINDELTPLIFESVQQNALAQIKKRFGKQTNAVLLLMAFHGYMWNASSKIVQGNLKLTHFIKKNLKKRMDEMNKAFEVDFDFQLQRLNEFSTTEYHVSTVNLMKNFFSNELETNARLSLVLEWLGLERNLLSTNLRKDNWYQVNGRAYGETIPETLSFKWLRLIEAELGISEMVELKFKKRFVMLSLNRTDKENIKWLEDYFLKEIMQIPNIYPCNVYLE